MNSALDSNILLYAEGIHGGSLDQRALDLISRLRFTETFISVQALGEVFNVLTRKAGRPRPEARRRVERWGELFQLVHTDREIMRTALELAAQANLRIWDAVQLAASATAACKVFLSEDLQHGFQWRGVTVVNPFAASPHPLFPVLFGED